MEKVRDFYMLKADLLTASVDPGSTRLVLEFDKKIDPQFSAERIRDLRGFVMVLFKKPRHSSDTEWFVPSEKETKILSSQDGKDSVTLKHWA